MRLLELFAGTGSVGNVFKEHGWEVVSLDRDMPADIQTDIMDWEYAEANEVVARTLEIIDYLSPKYFLIENPQSGLLKHQPVIQGRRYNDLDYCRYGLPYRKRTRIWNNLTTFEPLLCNKQCDGMSEDKKRHLQIAQHSRSKVGDTWKKSFSMTDLYRIPMALTEYIIQCIEKEELLRIYIIRRFEQDRLRCPPTELDFDNMPTA